MNLSKTELTKSEEDVLKKGLNVAPSSRSVPAVDIMTSVECALEKAKGVTAKTAEVVRAKMVGIVERFRTPTGKPNLSKEESSALRCLKSRDDIVVLPSVVMDKSDYTRKALSHIENAPFEQVTKCPEKKAEERLNKYLWKLFSAGQNEETLVQPATCICLSTPAFLCVVF